MIDNKVVRPWGYYINLFEGKKYLTKVIHVNCGGALSVQSHNHRSEHWFIACGKAKVILNESEFILEAGSSIDIPLRAVHSLQNPFEEELEVIETQCGDILSEEDIIRYKDIYGRI